MAAMPIAISRFSAIFFTPLYLLLLSSILSSANGCSLSSQIVVVFMAAAVNVWIIAVLSARSSRLGKSLRISISSLMLLTVPLTTYLTYVSQFIQPANVAWTTASVCRFMAYSLVMFVITTMVLVQFTHALRATASAARQLIKS